MEVWFPNSGGQLLSRLGAVWQNAEGKWMGAIRMTGKEIGPFDKCNDAIDAVEAEATKKD